MLDALELLQPDPRIGVLFAYDDRSVFHDGVLELLREVGALTVPWTDLDAAECDLIVSASENIAGAPRGVPLLVLPHGVGFHKLVPDASGVGRRVSGLVASDALDGRPFVLAVSDPGALAQLSAAQPAAASLALVTGDLAWEQLEASADLRQPYRAALGCAEDQRLVVISSTWGPHSQFGTWSSLAGELAGALPADEYRVAQVLHPNVWAALGPYRVRALMRDALDAGVALIAPHRGWQAALVAADLVVGDHGSVTFYAAALGRPLLLASFGTAEIVAGTPMAALGAHTARLDRQGGLLPQIARAIERPAQAELTRIARRTLPPEVPVGERLRSAMYELLDLVIPPRPAPRRAAGQPEVERRDARVFVVYAELVEDAQHEAVIAVSRRPAAADRGKACGGDGVRFLTAPADEPDRLLVEAADVVVGRVGEFPQAGAACDGLLARLPGSSVAAVALPAEGVCMLRLRGHEQLLTASLTPAPTDGTLPAACAYALLALTTQEGGLSTARTARVLLGPLTFTLALKP